MMEGGYSRNLERFDHNSTWVHPKKLKKKTINTIHTTCFYVNCKKIFTKNDEKLMYVDNSMKCNKNYLKNQRVSAARFSE